MSNGDFRRLTNAKRTLGALERIEALERDMGSIVKTFSTELNRLANEVNNLSEILNGVVATLGEETVGKAVVEARLKNLEMQAEQNRMRISEAVANGKLKAGEVIGPTSIIVGREFAKDAKEPNPPGVIFVNFHAVQEDVKASLLGKGIGAIVPTPVGGSFEVTGLFEAVPGTPVDAAENDDVAAAADEALLSDLGVSSEPTQEA